MKSLPSMLGWFAFAPLSIAVPCLASINELDTLPVREVTVFKDGHAFVRHEGRVAVNRTGEASLSRLPSPVIGTFWAYAADADTKLVSVLASQRRIQIERTALTIRELLEGNVGSEILVTETNETSYAGTILGFPTRSSEELAETEPDQPGERLSETGNLVLLKTVEGIKAIDIKHIRDVTFKTSPKSTSTQERLRPFLTMQLEANKTDSLRDAEVGLVYLQKGIRWIPSYKVDLNGEGQAVIRLQASLLNEMIDLEDVTLQLVIGVPTFAFKDQLDPMALQGTLAQLSAFFQGSTGQGRRQDALLSNFSNALMTQTPRMGGGRVASVGSSQPDLPEGTRNEDLFVFTIPHVTLRRGERMVLPVAEYQVAYEDVFVLDLPFAPPPEMARSLNNQQQAELARLSAAPKVMHRVRLSNDSDHPFTTAPALILREDRVIAQGLMTYTAIGASSDLSLTTAVDLQVKKSDRETKRTPNAFQHNGDRYMRVDLQGKIHVTNHREQSVKIEVRRYVLGQTDSVDHDGEITMSNVFESRDFLPTSGQGRGSNWWSWFNWPWWWHHVNGVGSITWELNLEAGQKVGLGYAWHYYWR